MNCFLSRMKIRYGKFMAIVSLFTLLLFPVAGTAQNLGKSPACSTPSTGYAT
jgi:hypothetical protein